MRTGHCQLRILKAEDLRVRPAPQLFCSSSRGIGDLFL